MLKFQLNTQNASKKPIAQLCLLNKQKNIGQELGLLHRASQSCLNKCAKRLCKTGGYCTIWSLVWKALAILWNSSYRKDSALLRAEIRKMDLIHHYWLTLLSKNQQQKKGFTCPLNFYQPSPSQNTSYGLDWCIYGRAWLTTAWG